MGKPQETRARWKFVADWSRRHDIVLRLADALGRVGYEGWLDGLATVPAARRRPDVARFVAARTGAIWVGHGTMLLRVNGVTVLVDPNFSLRIGPRLGLITAGTTRLVRPAISVESLPRVDVVLVTHAHFDHLDRPSLRRVLRRFPGALVVTTEAVGDLLADVGGRGVRELRVGETAEVGGVRVTAVPVRHWGARVFFDDHRTACAFLVAGGGRSILAGGDSAYTDAWSGVGPVDLACVGIGAYNPWIEGHANPEQAWAMAGHAGAARMAAVHHSTFVLSHEPTREPLARLLAAAGGEADRVVIREVGDMWVEEMS